ncbi:glycosyltransferase family protein [Alicyclobacillus fastidiosus]|uniref:Glycosyltransferase family protein n=1 Tax=Alicyclobacillus fastidiosus TaxID=392011 RepID=A0ABY6ZLN8_9BACL|nr:glycosyltransferase family protein [Alicyclobacillus fastidiosus]WAH43819.1 glycosyltransferase family protein [Alicyclobacillus fastidiosus]GMA60049.1 streptomycin biosynthesis protein StrF [Alicyclobacillus fastidiosus]
MNPTKISFVICVNDDNLYGTCMNHIQALNVPHGYSVEILPIHDAHSMTQAYNSAIRQSDAKYRVYLHQDVLIINPNFIGDILTVFMTEPRLGLLGMVGCKVLPPDGVWWKDHRLFGKVILPDRILELLPVEGTFEIVDAVDGLLMATQYDVWWREDLFDGFHLYDTSQCLEFKKHGYLVGVPNQHTPWCKHGFDVPIGNPDEWSTKAAAYERNHRIFIKNYLP